MKVKRIAIFASGSGTNAQNIIEYFSKYESVKVDSLWSNNPNSFALKRAQTLQVETFVFDRGRFYESDEIVHVLNNRKIDLIVLAGFLWLVPSNLTKNFKTINIHPALLPKYGGKGMFGMRVHNSVVENGETESGISIHWVNNKYDEGELIFQTKCPVLTSDSAEDVAKKVHQLEYKHFPIVIEKLLLKNTK
ncbi:MAG: phosphoribosylglycinamide formyltransferase [Prolixibacteraceae bacterium]|jgi:phosphoribosylglycinamide formyltransferase 1|nr:phosphoribosylglycinamide formyltransferase [Prolixibacteraceae bacterium]MBT6007469.1 phosphoribosylglycinamide formyltransferase [Prolixibacteraceae bacterium]MBT6766532.1 phosphoribosylglycinamide formyltransferase [Prolixibacteraceae bacterium]MBT6998388.1 phosphoribosylglycinamide formyltransferase [Prolixibacteraceae bacterium]MBT7397393.1 phosphoribosylglycinamide formyltransferase [Prolixibacteraceae bacterium]